MASWRPNAYSTLAAPSAPAPVSGMNKGFPFRVETGANLGEVLKVEIRRQDIDGRRARPPDVMHLGRRPSARVHPRPGEVRLLQPGVRVHRDVVFLLAGLRDCIHITGIVPRHEDLVGGPTDLPETVQVRLLVGRAVYPDGDFEILGSSLSENLLPGAGSLEPGLLPHVAELRYQRVFVLLEVVHQFFGNRPVKGLVGRLRTVPRVEQNPDLVLHLDHDDRVLRGHPPP